MIEQLSELPLRDNGGRRSGKDRREFSYSDYTPERRRLKERRSGFDRRVSTMCRRKYQRTQNRF